MGGKLARQTSAWQVGFPPPEFTVARGDNRGEGLAFMHPLSASALRLPQPPWPLPLR